MTYATVLLFLSAIGSIGAQYAGTPGSGYHSASVPQYVAPPAPTGQDGSVVDTPEVAQAKAAHFAEFARAAARAAENKAQESGEFEPRFPGADLQRPSYAYSSQVLPVPASAPYARQTYPGTVIPSTVQYQRTAPGSAYHRPQPQAQALYAPESKSFQVAPVKPPFVPAPLADDGTVIDTPEVAALKAVRLQELAEAEARAHKYGATEEFPAEGQAEQHYSPEQYQPRSQPRPYQSARPIPRTSYTGASPYSSAPQSFASVPRSYQPSAPIYQAQPQAYQSQSYSQAQSYQSQY